MMNEQAQRIAIAEACGWKIDKRYPDTWTPPGEKPIIDTAYYTARPPNYLQDLNAMHEAEKVLIGQTKQFAYENALAVVLKDTDCWNFDLLHATASRRAEAFLRTLKLWVDDAISATPESPTSPK